MTYYEVLEVREDASPEVISMAYKALCKKYHPDVYRGDDAEFAAKMMVELNEAYEVLSSPERRAYYDRLLEIAKLQKEPYSYQAESGGSPGSDAPIKEKPKKRSKKIIVALSLILIIAAAAWVGFENGYFPEDVDIEDMPPQIEEEHPSKISQIASAFDAFGMYLGFEGYIDMLDYFDEVEGDNFKDYVYLIDKFDKFATEYVGVDSYEQCYGYLSPYSNEEIDNYVDYQAYAFEYMWEMVSDLEESDGLDFDELGMRAKARDQISLAQNPDGYIIDPKHGEPNVDSFDMKKVDSTAIKEVGYSLFDDMLAIRFVENSDCVYVYYGVEHYVYEQLMNASSKGHYYNENIRGKYTVQKITD